MASVHSCMLYAFAGVYTQRSYPAAFAAAGDKVKAGEAFQKLQALDRSSAASAKMLGQLARASAQGNPQQALALSGNLPSIPKLSGVSLDDLEAKAAGWPADKRLTKLASHNVSK